MAENLGIRRTCTVKTAVRDHITRRRTLSQCCRSRLPRLYRRVGERPLSGQQRDRKIILAGLNWLDQQATEQNQAETFLQLEPAQQAAILDSICTPASATNREAAGFFRYCGPLYAALFLPPKREWMICNTLAINPRHLGRCRRKRCLTTWV